MKIEFGDVFPNACTLKKYIAKKQEILRDMLVPVKASIAVEKPPVRKKYTRKRRNLDFDCGKLREARLKSNLTQMDVSSMVGVSNFSISAYELGKARPKIETLNRMCLIYGISTASLLNDRAVH